MIKKLQESFEIFSSRVPESSLSESRGRWKSRALGIVYPRNTQDVVGIARFCDKNELPLLVQGGNTGLVGASCPDDSGDWLILSMSRMDQMLKLDLDSNVIQVQGGMVLDTIHKIASDNDRFFPLDLPSSLSCQIGGNIATNAGGVQALKFGVARDMVVGLEVVLINGEVINTLSELRKDNRGYDLVRLFIGSEGTLGIITAASLKLFPKPKQSLSVWVSFGSAAQALDCFNRINLSHQDKLYSFELMDRKFVDAVAEFNSSLSDKIPGRSNANVLMKFCSLMPQVNDPLEEEIAEALNEIIKEENEVFISQSMDQSNGWWQIRETSGGALSSMGFKIKHDVSVPISKIPDFLEQLEEKIHSASEDFDLSYFGHFGDGNLHISIKSPRNYDDEPLVNKIIYDLIDEFEGSFSAEHGIGLIRREELKRRILPTNYNLMKQLKILLDPKNLLNPNRVLYDIY